MLSRIAEALFWIGRYVERADNTARILDVHVHLLLEDPWANEDEVCRALLDVMGMPLPAEWVTVAEVLAALAYDPSGRGSIASSLAAARENCRGARECVSSEMWECLNVTYNSLGERQRAAARLGPHLYFQYVRERSGLFAGLTDATLSRDDGWRFLVLGRSLERVDMTARLLATRAVTGGHATTLTSVLRSCGAHESYLRAYRGMLDPAHVTEFLLLDRLFPRSVFSALTAAEDVLAALGPAEHAPAEGRLGTQDEAQRLLGRARATLEFRSADELLAELPRHLESLRQTCVEASGAVSRRFFKQAALVQWEQELFA